MAGETSRERGGRPGVVLDADRIPERAPLPRHLAPVPRQLEDLGLRLAPLVVLINLLGTAFGFYYYHQQLLATPAWLWPLVPDSPLATLLFAAALGAWAVGRPSETLAAFAFVGNVVYGAWTPLVLLVFRDSFATPEPMWQFLFWSHLAMVVQALVLHRIVDFEVRAVGLATLYYGANLVVDYFVPIVGDHGQHTALPVGPARPVALGATAHDLAAAGAVVLTLAAIYHALATGAAKRAARRNGDRDDRGDDHSDDGERGAGS